MTDAITIITAVCVKMMKIDNADTASNNEEETDGDYVDDDTDIIIITKE